MPWVLVGTLGKPHGLQGSIRCFPSGDLLSSLPLPVTLRIGSESGSELNLISCSPHGEAYLLRFQGCERIEAIEGWVRQSLFAPAHFLENLPREPGEFLVSELLGLRAFSLRAGQETEYSIQRVLSLPAGTVLEFSSPKSKELILVPFLERFVGRLDLENKRIECIDWEDWFEA